MNISPNIPLQDLYARAFQKGKENSEKNRIVLRKSIFLIAAHIICIELFFDCIYFVLRIPAYFLHLSVSIQNYLFPLYMFIFVMLTATKFIVILFVIIRWVTNCYEISPGIIKHNYGIFGHRERVYLCSLVQEVAYTQDFFGRLCNFGSITLHSPVLKEDIMLDSVQNPAKYTEIIRNMLPTIYTGYIAR